MLQMSRCIKESCELSLLKILSFVAQVIAPAVLFHAGAVKLCCSFDFYGDQFRPRVPHHIAGVCPIMQAIGGCSLHTMIIGCSLPKVGQSHGAAVVLDYLHREGGCSGKALAQTNAKKMF